MKKVLFVTQGIIQFFVGVGGLVCGALLTLFPSGEILQMPLDMLKDSPFPNYLIPGIILFLINGIGQLTAGVLTFRKHVLSAHVGAVFGMGLMIWIFVQVNLIGGGHILQYLYFALGVIETGLAFLIRDRLFGGRR